MNYPNFTPKPRIFTAEEDEQHGQEIRARYERASAEIVRMTSAPGGPGNAWRWSIPADPERDSDLILSASIEDVPRLLDRAERAERAAEDAKQAYDAERAKIERVQAALTADGNATPCCPHDASNNLADAIWHALAKPAPAKDRPKPAALTGQVPAPYMWLVANNGQMWRTTSR